MKQGISITDLAVEIERQAEAKHDYIADHSALSVTEDGKLRVMGVGHFGLNNHARRQLAAKLDIPLAYFDRLSEKHPDLLSHSCNTLLSRESGRSMVRTLDGEARGLMSDRYRPLDNYDLGNAVLPVIMQSGARVESCQITDTRLYIKLILPWLDRELPVPQGLKMGVGHNWFIRKVTGAVTISNSEVGAGTLAISPGIFEPQCTNLATYKDDGFAKMHIGKKAASDDPVAKWLSDDTKRIEDAAVWARVRDVLTATMDGRVIDGICERMTEARTDLITGDPAKVVEVFGKKNGLSEVERGGLLRHLGNAGEMNRYGLQWAVTRLAQDVESYDRASDLERLGGGVIELARNDWQALLAA